MKPYRIHHSFQLALAFWITTALFGCSQKAQPAAEKSASKPVPVKTVVVTEEKVERTTTQPATVYPYYRAEVRAKVSGYVKELKADIGDFVEQGASLAMIDVPELEKQRQVMEARILRHESEERQAEAGVELATANIRSAESKQEQAKSELKRADAFLAAAEVEFNRTSDLVERQSVEKRLLDEVRKKRDSELANKEAVTASINSAEAEVQVSLARKLSAEADLQAAQAATTISKRQLDELDVQIEYATLKAPFAGIVTYRSIDPGDLVREGSEVGKGEPLFVVSQVETVRVHISVPEADASLVTRGDAVTLSFPSFPAEQSIKAVVSRISGELDPSTRTMLVEVEMPNPDRKMVPGMFGQATITLATKAAANMLPARAIRFEESGQAYVYVVSNDDVISVIPISMGTDNGHSVEVLTGLVSGQRVVDAHLKRFSQGDKVQPLNP